MEKCPCGSELEYKTCCGRLHLNVTKACSAVELMKSRYCAYVKELPNYIYNTTHPKYRKYHSISSIKKWIQKVQFVRLEIVSFSENHVEFKAYFQNKGSLIVETHHEYSFFELEKETWYYTDANYPNN